MKLLTTITALFLLLGLAPRSLDAQTAAPAPAASATLEKLQHDLQAIFSERSVDHGIWSATVQSLQSGETLYRSNAYRLQVPASNQKLLTAAAAAERLGWDYRYTTRIYATGPVDSSGAMNGDLVVVSDGDPTINPRHPERWGKFEAWGKLLAERGIKQVNGYLIGDDRAFEEPGWGLGWAWDDLALGYGAAVNALQYNENQVELIVGPGLEPGARGIISVSPPGSGLTIDHQVTTVAAGEPGRITLLRQPGSALLTVSGQVAAGGPSLTEYAAVDNPTLFYLNTMRVAFGRSGVKIDRAPLDIDNATHRAVDLSKATLLIEDTSPPLAEIIDVTLKWSRNIYAETMLRSMAPVAERKSAAAGLKALEETLNDWGIFREYFLARDGSGLSRYDYLTTDAAAWLLTYVWRDPKLAEPYKLSLPVFGMNGNVANRLKETPAGGRVWAKTGSMSQVRSLSGYLETLDREPLVFSFIVNGFRVPQREIDAAMDRALLRLIAVPANR